MPYLTVVNTVVADGGLPQINRLDSRSMGNYTMMTGMNFSALNGYLTSQGSEK